MCDVIRREEVNPKNTIQKHIPLLGCSPYCDAVQLSLVF
jgi:hypothetical protein